MVRRRFGRSIGNFFTEYLRLADSWFEKIKVADTTPMKGHISTPIDVPSLVPNVRIADHQEIGLGGELMVVRLFAGRENRRELNSVLRRFVASLLRGHVGRYNSGNERIPRGDINEAYV